MCQLAMEVEKPMKKILAFFIILVVSFQFIGCLELDRFFNGETKREKVQKKIKAQKFFVGKVKKIVKNKRFKDPKLTGTVNKLGLWMAKEVCATSLNRYEEEYHKLIMKADKLVKKKELPDEFFALYDEVVAHNNKMNIEYSLLCQKNPSGDDMSKVKDSDVIATTVYHLFRKCKDKYNNPVLTSLIANNFFLFCN